MKEERDETDQLIAKNLRRIRLAKNMSQADVGKAVGMDKDKISAYENAHIVMGKGVMTRFCKALNVEIWEFYWTEKTPVVLDEREKECLHIFREAKLIGVDEQITQYGEFMVNQARQKKGSGPKGTGARVARTKRRAG